MSHEILRNLSICDQEKFAQVTRHYGYAAAACYRLVGKNLIFVIGTSSDDTKEWPPIATFSSDYTPRKGGRLPLGWIKPPFLAETRKIWPKGISFYFCAQDWSSTKIIFVVKNGTGKRTRIGDLDGPLETLAGNMCSNIDQGELRHFISEAHSMEQMKRVTTDLQLMLDHEIRTPLTSIMGYSQMLFDADSKESEEYCKIIYDETERSLEALKKITDLFEIDWSPSHDQKEKIKVIDMRDLCNEVCETAKGESEKWAVPIGINSKLSLIFRKPVDQNLKVRGHLHLIRNAIFEVVKNAVMYSDHGKISVTLYSSNDMIVLDVEDDGPGIASGAEELIFHKFFQGPLDKSMKKIKRGLGVGLYLAKYVAEQHSGNLSFIRGAGKSGVFRFLLPVYTPDESALDQYGEGKSA